MSLFSHPSFDAALLMTYLFRTFAKGGESGGIREYLIHRMFSLSDVDVERYVPQIVCILCHRGAAASLSSLEKFVLDRCRSSLHLALKFFWYVQSYVEDEGTAPAPASSFVRQLRSNCEMSLVNGQMLSENSNNDDDALDKVARSEYFTRVTQFVDRLMRISNTLRSVPPPERARQLQTRLQDLVSQPVYVPLWPADSPHFTVARFRGIFFFFFVCFAERFCRLPVSEGLVLASRDRVPYMIFLEVLQSKTACSNEPNAHRHSDEIHALMQRMRQDASNLDVNVDASPVREAIEVSGDAPSPADQKALEKWMEKQSEGTGEETGPVNGRQSESWSERRARLAKESPFSADPNWQVLSFVVKYGDDCRQELLAVQLLGAVKRVFERAALPLWISPHHQVLVVGKHAAIVETIPDVKSVHQHKKMMGTGDTSVSAMFRAWFGKPGSREYELGQKNFVESLAGYSCACYLLQFKDRHNGNILLDR